MQKEVILALDISTSYVGWCLVDNLGTLVAADAIDLKKMVDMFSKARVVHQTFARLNNENLIKRIVVEENLQAFRPGFSSAKTICTLARFNGMVSLLANQATEIVPEFVNVNHARKSIGLKIDRKSDIPTKEQILEWVKNHGMEKFSWPMRTMKSGPRKGLVISHERCYDIADAFVVAKSCVIDGR